MLLSLKSLHLNTKTVTEGSEDLDRGRGVERCEGNSLT